MQDRARGGSTELERRLDGEREVREGGGRGEKKTEEEEWRGAGRHG